MNKVRTMLLLAVAALAAVAMAAPVTASAAQWTKEGEPLTQEETIQLNGTLGHYGPQGTWAQWCPVSMEATLYPGEEGKVTSLEVDGINCDGAGPYAGCIVEETKTNLPWTFRAKATVSHEVNFDTTGYAHFFQEACPYSYFSNATPLEGLVPDNSEAMTKLANVYFSPYAPVGTFEVVPAGVYGIAE